MLSRELEQLGWEIAGVYRDGGTMVLSKKLSDDERYELIFRGENKLQNSDRILITEVRQGMDQIYTDRKFSGHCPDIETFKLLCKLLEI